MATNTPNTVIPPSIRNNVVQRPTGVVGFPPMGSPPTRLNSANHIDWSKLAKSLLAAPSAPSRTNADSSASVASRPA